MHEADKTLENIQKLVLEIIAVERNHSIPGTERHENVVEHSFSLAMLCWRIFEVVKPHLDIALILKYALIHDFTERGQRQDVNTYAKERERDNKKKLERDEFTKLSEEFADFENFMETLANYEACIDDEALFVWSVDKMQAIILGQIDNWRPYAGYGVSYEQYCNKIDEFIKRCSPFVRDIFMKVYEASKKTYYDNPVNKAGGSKKYEMA